MSKLTYGAELALRLGEGIAKRVPTKRVKEVMTEVSSACEELIRIGARIRPLLADGKNVGWVRGLHDTERRMLRRWLPDEFDFILRCLLLTTSLTEDEVSRMSIMEVNKLIKLALAMGDRDASLFPYLMAFSTTRESENLWHGGGTVHCSFENKAVTMPDGKRMTILLPPDHARLWASLCTYREQAKKRLDESWNAVLIMRPWAGKSVDGIASNLRAATKSLEVNNLEPWESVVKVAPDKSLDDGWAHIENMETKEGAYKELMSMLGNDRHERLMAEFEKQQIAAAEKRKKDIERIVTGRGGPGIHEETITILTEDEMRKREAELTRGRIVAPPVDRQKAEGGSAVSVQEKLKRYQ
jgi:hypothetical protein